jgi:hypothetical protein
MNKKTLWTCGSAAAALLGAATSPAAAQAGSAPADEKSSRTDGSTRATPPPRALEGFEGYDFGQVVETMETSVNPLQREMERSFRVFIESIEEAERMLDEGSTQEAVQKAAAAIDGVLAVRDTVLVPMWDGQAALVGQIAIARARLAQAVEASSRGGPTRLDQQTEATLDAIARRVAAENDPLRKKRLVAHYRTVRNLARIRVMAVQLSPDQRKMWMSVLQVLDEAASAHQQVMMGSEVLFAQLEATSANLKAYVSLMETVDGASHLMRIVRGVDDHSAGMASFAGSMNELQQRLAAFNESVEVALQGRMVELEAQIEMIGAPGGVEGAVIAAEEDQELLMRISRLHQEGQTPLARSGP